jgi:hypothetical protein
MAKVAFDIGPVGARIDAMRLVIRVRTDEASLMHPVTDLLRFHDAGRIPEGSGRIWDYSGQTRQANLKAYRARVDWSLRWFAGGRWQSRPPLRQFGYVTPYTNARGINWGEEARVFMDEWSTIDVADPSPNPEGE